MIGGTVLVWKYGPLQVDGNPTWPADFGIFFQCFILFIIALIHFFAWGNIVMMNTPILLACAIGGFIIQLIEKRFYILECLGRIISRGTRPAEERMSACSDKIVLELNKADFTKM